MNKLDILFEDNYMLVVNKPGGLMVEDDRYKNPSLFSLVENYLQQITKREVFLANVHRLDRPASGILVFAKKRSSLKNLAEQFQEKKVKKTYLAITNKSSCEKEGRLENFLFKDLKNRKAVIFDKEVKDSQPVKLEYKINVEVQDKLLWEINLITGKYHQIRAQLAHIGCPIIGDRKYGSQEEYQKEKICLHAWKLEINHPVTGEVVKVEANRPGDFPWKSFLL